MYVASKIFSLSLALYGGLLHKYSQVASDMDRKDLERIGNHGASLFHAASEPPKEPPATTQVAEEP
jgi:hypothetical protein